MPKTRTSMSSQDLIAVIIAGVFCILLVGGVVGAPIIMPLTIALGFSFAIYGYSRIMARADLPQQPQSDVPPPSIVVTGDYPLAEGFSEAIITIGDKGQIIYSNPAAQKMFGYKGTSTTYAHIVRQPEVAKIIEDALSGTTPEPVSYLIETPVARHVQAVATPIMANPEITGGQRVLVVFHDITDIVLSNTLRSDFLANASHELKTPVASLLGYIETLRGHARNDADARDRFLVIMQEQAERMQRLINDLLSLRRIEQTEHQAPTETADLYLAVQTAMEVVAPIAKDRKVKISLSDAKRIPVIGEPDELVQLTLNLIDNAVKMSPAGSTVQISLETIDQWRPGEEYAHAPLVQGAPQRRIVGIGDTDEAYGVVRIRDAGPGFAREHLPRLGERFYRIAGDRSSREKGTGLGLAIVKHIVRRHRGGLFIESAEGAGTEFSILIPAAP